MPSPRHDIFVLTRPTASAKARVTFREPGKPNFELELPLSSSLALVKAALVAESASRQTKPSGRSSPTPAAEDVRDLDCTLIVRGKTVSNACLLGDYISPAAVPGSRRRRRPASILVLWRRRQEPAEAAKQHPGQRNTASPTARIAAACALVRAGRYLGGSEESVRWRSRRSVQRRSKVVVGFSGLKRGVRCGLGIRPLSEAATERLVAEDGRRRGERGGERSVAV